MELITPTSLSISFNPIYFYFNFGIKKMDFFSIFGDSEAVVQTDAM